ncbi:HEPN domain-containing protein [Flavivirga eckloniae]|uniref:HEPN domain-containing protein n=1 Tax=Flavivirga eckloniae TaxID=1803846 RepID=A0A2K9PS83_9FLAO|nr:HEPN domain-containing protein [Flavivirga eckloniae]AUP79924.1 hypothetical protein C1H87_14920 [Flavivirga eckloniae]
MKNEASKYFFNASQKLNQANDELFKPGEDIANHLICKNSQYAIVHYLKGFLVENGIDTRNFRTIHDLYEQCIKINRDFKDIDLLDFDCKWRKSDCTTYCYIPSKASTCFNIANSLDWF